MEGGTDYTVTDETPFTDTFCNADNRVAATLIVAFEDNKNTWAKDRPTVSDEWGQWYPIGNSGDYKDNADFARLSGAPVKIDNEPSGEAAQSEQQG